MKHTIRRAITSTVGRITAASGSRRVVVLCYHSIHRSLPFASASPDLFRRQLEWLAEHCQVVALEDVLAATTEDGEQPPAVAITFDDGYEDNFTDAYPALAQAGMTATFFVTAGLVQRDPAVLRRMSGLYGVGEGVVRPMDWDQVRQLAAEGFAIGSHTYAHPNLARLGRSEVRADLERARAVLEDRLHAPVRLFAYPFGRPRFHLTAETVELVRAAGHTTAAAVLFRGVRPADDALMIPRFFVGGDDVATIEEKVVGRWDPMGLWQEHLQRGVLPLRLDSTNRAYE